MARKIKSIEEATALLPWLIAETVAREACVHCGDETPMGYAGTLQARAEAVYMANAAFRRKLRAATGRDYTYMFMRHWLAALLKENHPDLFAKLPPAFALGSN